MPLDDLLRDAPPAKRAILLEGLKLFASRGYEAVSVRDIAAATGFSNPALFRHFASKDALAEALFTACYRQLVKALEDVSDERDFGAWLCAILSEIERAPEAVHFVLENVRRFWPTLPASLRAKNIPKLVRLRLERERARGLLRADFDLELARTLIVGALAQIARSTHFRDAPIDPPMMAQSLEDLLINGLKARSKA